MINIEASEISEVSIADIAPFPSETLGGEIVPERRKWEVNFAKMTAKGMGIRGVVGEIRDFFGWENYEEFRRANKTGEFVYIDKDGHERGETRREAKRRVNQEIYEKVGNEYGSEERGRRRFWKQVMLMADETVGVARGILFADQDRKAALTGNSYWDRRTPSSILERLTKPANKIGNRLRSEQYRRLAVGLLCADEMKEDVDNDEAVTGALEDMNDYLEKNFFIGKEGDPIDMPIYSYHKPRTNELVGLSSQYLDTDFAEGLWVKYIEYPVRVVGIKDKEGNVVETVKVLYDQDRKEFGARVIKGMQRSRKANGFHPDSRIETTPYGEDKDRFRLVVMYTGNDPEEGKRLRDEVTAEFDRVMRERSERYKVEPDDQVDPTNGNGKPDRFPQRGRKISIKGLKRPIEMRALTLADYISTEYEVGKFDPVLGRHDGRGHAFYKLEQVVAVADGFWDAETFGINIAESVKASSYKHALLLGLEKRIFPSPYKDDESTQEESLAIENNPIFMYGLGI